MSKTKETFRDKAQKLAEIVFADEELQEVVRAWPKMSPQAKHICRKLVGMTDDG